MNTARDYLHELIDQIEEKEIPEAIDFLKYLKRKKDRDEFRDFEEASQSAMGFWDNPIDDEVWNDA
jgi:hypothetical protein